MSKPIILVTGATGKTGNPVVEQLLALELPVRAFVHRIDERSERLEALGAEILQGDFLDLQSVRSAMQGVKRIYFCYPPQGDRLLEAATNVAVAARDAGVEALVNMSLCAGGSREPPGPPPLVVGTGTRLGQNRRLTHSPDLLCGRPLSVQRPKHC